MTSVWRWYVAQVYEELKVGGVFDDEGGIPRTHLFLSVHDAVLHAQHTSTGNTTGLSKAGSVCYSCYDRPFKDIGCILSGSLLQALFSRHVTSYRQTSYHPSVA